MISASLLSGLSLFAASDSVVPLVPHLPATIWHWVAFSSFVVIMLVLDLGVFHRHSRETTLKEAAFWTAFWSSLALIFNGIIWWWGGSKPAGLFLAGYLVEWSLSMDNVFVFAVIFGYFKVPMKYQYRVLFWGIMGAIIMRLLFILAGAALIERFDWILVVLGVFLGYTGIKLAMHDNDQVDPEASWVLRIARKMLPVSKENHGEQFFAREAGKFCVTPLFLVLLVVESTDVAFALDSVPAIFGITSDPFIVFTSNIFAIMGLRALYFLLAGVMDMFRYLRFGLAAILVFVGGKMLATYFLKVHLPPWASLVVIVTLLGGSIIASLVAAKRDPPAEPPAPVADPELQVDPASDVSPEEPLAD